MKYVLQQIDETTGNEVIHKFNAVSLTDMLENYQYFLKGCGFHIDKNASIDVVASDDCGCSQKPYADAIING